MEKEKLIRIAIAVVIVVTFSLIGHFLQLSVYHDIEKRYNDCVTDGRSDVACGFISNFGESKQ